MINDATTAIEMTAQLIGYFVMIAAGAAIVLAVYIKRQSSNVSDEAKQMAKEVDPNNPVVQAAAGPVFDSILDEVRDLQPDETIRSDPEPFTHFDWSIKTQTSRQEHIEAVLEALADAGFYTHPLPEIENYRDESKWSRERAGVWLSEPDWHIVEYNEDGSKQIKDRVELSVPEQWRPKSEQTGQ